MAKITISIIKELLTYNKNTGIFIWNKRNVMWFSHCKNPSHQCNIWNSKYAGTIAGSACRGNGKLKKYRRIGISFGFKSKTYKEHRLAFIYMTGKCPEQIDHIDHNGFNNKWKNLRIANNIINQQNSSMRKDNVSGFTGVNFCKRSGRWIVRIQANGKRINGGRFIDIKDAIEKRKSMNIEYGFHKNHGRKLIG